MNETPQEYTRRILANVGNGEPRKVQAATPKKLAGLIRGAAAGKLRKRPAPGKWSVGEILAHMADVEMAVGWRLRQILAEPGIALQAFDQDLWATSGHYEKRDPRQSLEQFSVLRKANLTLLKSLTAVQWQHFGMHAERGKESVEHIVRMIAGHDINHLNQVERILKPGK
jgi:hypothetical protein